MMEKYQKLYKLNEKGICDACLVKEQKASIDWVAREQELRELCDKFRRNDGHYDCLVPGMEGRQLHAGTSSKV